MVGGVDSGTRTGGVAGVTALVAALLLVAPDGARAVDVTHPSRLTGLGAARQVVVVSATSWSSSVARLRAWERAPDGTWALVMGPVPARVGRNGFVRAAARRQGSATTPAGTFGLLRAFGTWGDPGTALPYRQVDGNDWWPYDPRDPATYNVVQTRRSPASDWRETWAEHLSSFGRQYRHAVVLDFNLPAGVHRSGSERVAGDPADTRRGGGIFLHVDRPGATTGCLSVAQPDLRRLLRWLDPAAAPVIVAGPRSALATL